MKIPAKSLLVAALSCWTAAIPWKLQAQEAPRVTIDGNVSLADGTPICAMVLANGQYMFSCDGTGAYRLNVPLDPNGDITLFSFADGFAPFKTTVGPNNFPYPVQMRTAAPGSPSIETFLDEIICASSASSVRIRGAVTADYGVPLCALVLANGQHMFSCGESHGSYDFILPLDDLGQATLFAFADGFQPHSRTFTPQCGGPVDPAEEILGTYVIEDQFGLAVLSFFADGTFQEAEGGDTAGDEFGTYLYDPLTSQLSYTVTIDRNGSGGLDDETVPDGSTQTLGAHASFRGLTLGFGPQDGVFLERQYPSPSSIQGTWRTEGGILTLLDNGQFVLSEVGGEPPNGMEAGPYFFDEENAKLTFYVYVDQNIGGGLIDNANIDGQSVTFPVSFDETSLNLFADGGWITFWRQ